jgi:hypothetical protein
MKEALSSSETSVLTRATWHNILEDAILHSHRRENLNSYIKADVWFLDAATTLYWFIWKERSISFDVTLNLLSL